MIRLSHKSQYAELRTLAFDTTSETNRAGDFGAALTLARAVSELKLCDRRIRSPIDPVGPDGSGSYSRFGRRPTAQLNLPTPAIASSAERNWSPSGRSWRCASLPGRHRSKSLRVYVLRPPLPARSAIESCGKSVQSGLGSTSSASSSRNHCEPARMGSRSRWRLTLPDDIDGESFAEELRQQQLFVKNFAISRCDRPACAMMFLAHASNELHASSR